MRITMSFGLAVGLALAVGLSPARADKPAAKGETKGMIGHMVYFTLTDNSPAAREKLVEACKKYLDKHDGVVYFSAGVVGDEFDREVNVRDWDVALHLVFKDKAAHDKYQDDARHVKFLEENKGNLKKVRVFDSVVK